MLNCAETIVCKINLQKTNYKIYEVNFIAGYVIVTFVRHGKKKHKYLSLDSIRLMQFNGKYDENGKKIYLVVKRWPPTDNPFCTDPYLKDYYGWGILTSKKDKQQ